MWSFSEVEVEVSIGSESQLVRLTIERDSWRYLVDEDGWWQASFDRMARRRGAFSGCELYDGKIIVDVGGMSTPCSSSRSCSGPRCRGAPARRESGAEGATARQRKKGAQCEEGRGVYGLCVSDVSLRAAPISTRQSVDQAVCQ